MENLTKTQKLVRTAMLAAITLLLVVTPLGYIPINPLITVTIVVTPVVLGGLLYGWPAGLVLSLVFGLSSFFRAPGEALGQIMLAQSGLYTFLTCVVPRVLVGLFGGAMHSVLKKRKVRKLWFYALTGLGGSMLNTLLFLGFIWFMFDPQKTGVTGAVIVSVASFNGLIEAVVNAVLVAVLAQVLLRIPGAKKN
ncbi:MAG: ECF transporter S component [Oscillospiraceae bacterium]